MPQWTKKLTTLRDVLASLLPFRQDALPYLDAAGISWLTIDMGSNPITIWHNILTYANANEQVAGLVDAVLEKFPKNPHLLAYKQPEDEDYNLGPDIKDTEWKDAAPVETLEKITGSVSTLLPISFLATGLRMAKAVARVYIKRGSKAEVGTGFLLPGNVFVTNNHVIKDAATAAIAAIQFDYEESEDGNPLAVTAFKLDPAKGFATSVADDWTAIKVKDDANAEFGALEPVENIVVQKDDFVNIIQHPGGRFKQIGLYHNLVTFSNDKIVQYLTDTEPGSSGSPVFNSQWQLVALHHSGGMLREPGSKQRLLRNEGININLVIEGLKANNLL
jgi:V8-like Glu-specific endopeptidase